MSSEEGRFKLYKVTLQGFQNYDGTGALSQVSYVVATDPTAAYSIVREYLDRKDYGFRKDRELSQIELVADAKDHPECRTRLFLTGGVVNV